MTAVGPSPRITVSCMTSHYMSAPNMQHLSSLPVFTSGVSVTRSLVLYVCFVDRCLSLKLSFFFWPLCCLSFFDLRILITSLISSNSSCNTIPTFHLCSNDALALDIWEIFILFNNLDQEQDSNVWNDMSIHNYILTTGHVESNSTKFKIAYMFTGVTKGGQLYGLLASVSYIQLPLQSLCNKLALYPFVT